MISDKRNKKDIYQVETIESYDDLKKSLDNIPERWIYRSQPSNCELTTTFERECLKSQIYNIKQRKKKEGPDLV